MGDLLLFPASREHRRHDSDDEMSSCQAIDAIVTAMVCHVMPLWVEKRWPFKAIEILAEELRDAMGKNPPRTVNRWQVDAMIDELRPAWSAIAQEAIRFF